MISEKKKVSIIEKYISRETTADMHKNEMRFYSLVKLGRKEEVLQILNKGAFAANKDKKLSEDRVQSLKYHLTITAAMRRQTSPFAILKYLQAASIFQMLPEEKSRRLL